MVVHVDEVTTDVVPERPGPAARPDADGGPSEPEWKRLARFRALRCRLRALEERTRAEGFHD